MNTLFPLRHEIHVDLLAVIVYSPILESKQKSVRLPQNKTGFNPFTTSIPTASTNSGITSNLKQDATNNDCCMPDFMTLWCDPNWTGLCIEANSILGNAKNEKSSIFRVTGSFNMMNPSTLQCGLQTCFHQGDDDNHENLAIATVCNSIKCHFFISRIQQQNSNLKHEYTREFLYSSSFPLINTTTEIGIYGLFNYNYDEDTCRSLPFVRLIIADVQPRFIPFDAVKLLALPGPDKIFHKSMMEISEWFQIVLQVICPDSKSSFLNFRTLLRDYGNCPLFQHLSFLYQNPSGTTLPPEILFYVCYHSMILNCLPSSQLLHFMKFDDLCEIHTFNTKRGARGIAMVNIEDKHQISIVLRLLGNMMVPWTVCLYEGLYQSDVSLGQDVEDQPFPMSFVCGNRIFKKDDCEGRASEAQQMVIMLKSLYIMICNQHRKTNKESIRNLIKQMAYTYSRKSPELTRLRVTLETWIDIISISFSLGYYVYHGIIEIHTTVGEVKFASFKAEDVCNNEEENSNDGGGGTGHSFGILIYNDLATHITHAAILEATGWERTMLEVDTPITMEESKMIIQLAELKTSLNVTSMNICGHLTSTRENSMYNSICLGNDSIFFTCPSISYRNLKYGIGLKSFKNGEVQKLDTQKLLHECSDEREPIHSFRISTLDFIEELIRIGDYTNGSSTRVPFFIRQNWIFPECIKQKQAFNEWNRALRKARDIRSLFLNYISKLPMIRRCLATPQKKEEDFLDIMQSHWKILEDTHTNNRNTGCSGFYVAVSDENTQQFIADYIQQISQQKPDLSITVQLHPCMRSDVLNISVSSKNMCCDFDLE